MLSFECIKNEKSVYFLLTSANGRNFCKQIGRGDPRPAKAVFVETHAQQNRNDLFHSFSITYIRVIGIGDYFLSFF